MKSKRAWIAASLFGGSDKQRAAPSGSSRSVPYLPQLDGLRGIAVLLVLLAHGSNTVDVPLLAPFWKAVEILRTGYVGVDLFFALSGFLITRLLLDERRVTGGIDLRRFYVRRTLRIFPIYYLTILVVSFTWPTTPGLRLSLLAYAFNYYAPFYLTSYPLEHTWSLAVEEQFYLVWPMLLSALPLAALPLVTGKFAPTLALAVAAAFALLLPATLAGELIYMTLPTRMLSLMLGASLAVAESRRRPIGLRLSLLTMTAGSAVLLAGLTGRAVHLVPPGGVYWCFALVGYGAFAAGAVGAAADAWHPLVAALSWPPLRFVGRISYGLYLYHLPVLYLPRDQSGRDKRAWRVGGTPAARLRAGLHRGYSLLLCAGAALAAQPRLDCGAAAPA